MSTVSDQLSKVSRVFKDISFNFTKHPVTHDVVILKNEEAIKQSVKNLVLTKIGERLFKPFLGTNTTSYLFELNSTISENTLIEEIELVLQTYEPRIRLQRISTNITEDSNEFDVVIDYSIVGIPNIIQTLDFILVRES